MFMARKIYEKIVLAFISDTCYRQEQVHPIMNVFENSLNIIDKKKKFLKKNLIKIKLKIKKKKLLLLLLLINNKNKLILLLNSFSLTHITCYIFHTSIFFNNTAMQSYGFKVIKTNKNK